MVLTPMAPKPEPKKLIGKLARQGNGFFLKISKGYQLAPDVIERAAGF